VREFIQITGSRWAFDATESQSSIHLLRAQHRKQGDRFAALGKCEQSQLGARTRM